jgi:hypothetical protein
MALAGGCRYTGREPVPPLDHRRPGQPELPGSAGGARTVRNGQHDPRPFPYVPQQPSKTASTTPTSRDRHH